MKTKSQLKTLLLGIITCFKFFVNAQDMPDKIAKLNAKLEGLTFNEQHKLVNKEIKKNPNEPWYYWTLATICDFEGDLKNSLKNYEKSIDLNPNFAAGHASIASFLYYHDSTQLDKAFMHINKAISLEPKAYYVHIDRANMYLMKKEYDLAIKDAKIELSLPDKDVYAAYQVIIKALYAQDKQSELISLLKKIDMTNGDYDTDFVLLLGSLYEKMNEFEKACKCYKNAAVPYERMKKEMPSNLATKLKNCKQ